MNFFELYGIAKHEGEVALDGRKARQRFITHLAQIVLIEAVEVDLGDKNILPQFAGGGHIGMKLAKLGDSSGIQPGAGGASGMIVIGRLRVVIEGPMAEGCEQGLDIALQVEEREWTRRRTRSQSAHHLRIHAARRTD